MNRFYRSTAQRISALFLLLAFLSPVPWGMAATPKADINTVTLEQLESVKGIGHDTAQEILTYQKKHGRIQSMDDLRQVKGVGKVRLEALQRAFTVKPLPGESLTKPIQSPY